MPVALDSQEGAKHVICIGPRTRHLYVNGSDLPSVEPTVAAKLKQDPSIDYLLAQEATKSGQVQWTIDQQPYVQGFLAIDSLWLYLTNGNTVGGGKAAGRCHSTGHH